MSTVSSISPTSSAQCRISRPRYRRGNHGQRPTARYVRRPAWFSSSAIWQPDCPAPTTRTPPSGSCSGLRYSLVWSWSTSSGARLSEGGGRAALERSRGDDHAVGGQLSVAGLQEVAVAVGSQRSRPRRPPVRAPQRHVHSRRGGRSPRPAARRRPARARGSRARGAAASSSACSGRSRPSAASARSRPRVRARARRARRRVSSGGGWSRALPDRRRSRPSAPFG